MAILRMSFVKRSWLLPHWLFLRIFIFRSGRNGEQKLPSRGKKALSRSLLLFLNRKAVDPYKEAELFVDPEKGVESAEDALSGARDIIAEMVSEDQNARAALRNLFTSKGKVHMQGGHRQGTGRIKIQGLF